jgi:hypothetical protein
LKQCVWMMLLRNEEENTNSIVGRNRVLYAFRKLKKLKKALKGDDNETYALFKEKIAHGSSA